MDQQQENRLKKRAISRERCEDLHRIATFLGTDTEDGALVAEVAEFMLDARQALKGGRRNVRSSRHWPEDDPILN